MHPAPFLIAVLPFVQVWFVSCRRAVMRVEWFALFRRSAFEEGKDERHAGVRRANVAGCSE